MSFRSETGMYMSALEKRLRIPATILSLKCILLFMLHALNDQATHHQGVGKVQDISDAGSFAN